MTKKKTEPGLLEKAKAAKIAAEITKIKKEAGELVPAEDLERARRDQVEEDADRVWRKLKGLAAALDSAKLLKKGKAAEANELIRRFILDDLAGD